MSDLVAIAYDDVPTAQQVASNLGEAIKGHEIEVDDVVIVERKGDGKVKLHQPSLAGLGAASGAVWGGLIGLIFLVPLFGMALGAAAGAAGGALTDTGVDDDFMKRLGEELEPGKAALIVLVRQDVGRQGAASDQDPRHGHPDVAQQRRRAEAARGARRRTRLRRASPRSRTSWCAPVPRGPGSARGRRAPHPAGRIGSCSGMAFSFSSGATGSIAITLDLYGHLVPGAHGGPRSCSTPTWLAPPGPRTRRKVEF